MNRLISTLLWSILAVQVMAQSPVQIRGELQKERIVPVKLFKVEQGNMVEIATSTPMDGGKFGFIFYPEYEGYYALGTGNTGSQTDNYKFYFKGGDQLDIIITDTGSQLSGKNNSKENTVLHKWYALVKPLEDKAFYWTKVQSTFVDFFPDLERIVSEANGFASRNKTGNTKFDREFPSFMKWDLASYASNFLNTPRSAHPSAEELSPYYSTLDIADFSKNTGTVYQMPWGNRTLGGIYSVVRRKGNGSYPKGIAALEEELHFLANDTLKGDAVLNYAERQKDFAVYKEAMDKYGTYVLTDAQKQRSIAKLTELAQLKAGDQGLNFAYSDKDGKMVRFEDLQGKVVLIDVWATWCGPCRAQFPHLKQLEEDMEGKDVAIVSISTDAEKDKEKWKQMIKDEGLGGIQLYAGQGNDFSKYYKVNTIPRFLVFDKQGKIVSLDAPRPSDPALKELLLKELAK